MAVAQRLSNSSAVEEFVTEATVEALNAALEAHNVSPDRIISVIHLDGTHVGNGPGARFRVLYHA